MKRYFGFLAALAVMLVAAVAWGEPCPPCPPVDVSVALSEQAQTWWMVLLDALVQLAAPFVAVAITALASVGLKRWFAKLEREGRKIDVETQEAILRALDGLVRGGVSFAEEQARKALRYNEVKTEGADKMQLAVDFVMGNLDESQLLRIGREELERLIESRLAQERAAPDGVVENTSPAPRADVTSDL